MRRSLPVFLLFGCCDLLFYEYLYGLWRADVFARQAKYAVLFPYHKGLFFRRGMARGVQPFINIHRAGVNAGAVGYAYVKIHTDIGSPYPQLAGCVVWTPHRNSLEFPNRLPL